MVKSKEIKNILIGVCGGISAYKTCELVRLCVKNGFSVKVMITEAAGKFVTPLTFQTLSANPVYLDMFTPLDSKFHKPVGKYLTGFSLFKEENIEHISLTQWADLCVIAPVSANTLSKIAQGICDNLLTTVVCALPQETKVLLAPAMNENMWKNPIIHDNVKKLKSLKRYIILNPQEGELACGVYGEGRMPEPKEIFANIKTYLEA